MPREDWLERRLRESGFLWRPQRARRWSWSTGATASATWWRIDEKRLIAYLSDRRASPPTADQIASILKDRGGRVRFLPSSSRGRRVLWHITSAALNAARRPRETFRGEGITVYEVPIAFFLGDYSEGKNSSALLAGISSWWAMRPRGIRVSPPPELQSLIWVDIAFLGALSAMFVLLVTGKLSSGKYCEAHSVWCGAAGSVVAAVVLGTVGLVLFYIHAHRAIKHYLLDARGLHSPRTYGRSHRATFSADAQHAEELQPDIKDIMAALGVAPWPRRIARNLARLAGATSGAPATARLIVGRPGAGKTTLLRALGCELAKAGYVPVAVEPIALRSGEQLAALARRELRDRLELAGISGKEGERTLQWITQSGRVVILADDLHRLAELGHADLAGLVLGAAEQRCSVLATARRTSVPVGLEQWVIDIEELQPTAVGDTSRTTVRMAAARWQEMVDEGLAPHWPTSPNELVRNLTARGDLHQSRFFTAHVLPRLMCAGSHDALTNLAESIDLAAGEICSRLLDAYIQAFVEGELRPHLAQPEATTDEIEAAERAKEQRRSLVTLLESAALSAIIERTDAHVDATMPGAEQAMLAGLLRPINGELATLEHAILQSYLASRRLVAQGIVPELVLRAGSAEADDAILLYAGRRDRQLEARTSCERLYEQIGMPESKRVRMRIAITAADVACRAWIDTTSPLDAIRRCWSTAAALEKCEAITRVARMATPEAIVFLWSHTQDADYRVRWSVARGITDNVFPAGLLYDTLRERIADAFSSAELLKWRSGEVDDWEPQILPLKMLAWTLPALELASHDADERARLADDIDHLLWLMDGRTHGRHEHSPTFAGITKQLGLEASVAQGFRAAARLAARPALQDRHLDGAWTATIRRLHGRLEALLTTSEFWYSELLLLHGLAELRIAAHAGSSMEPASLPDTALSAMVNKSHPLLRRSAVLCDRATNKAAERARREAARKPALTDDDRSALLEKLWELSDEYIWGDEGVAVRAVRTRLRHPALLLLGEVTLLLNLNERGTATERQHLARRRDLPRCLSAGPREQWSMLGEDWRGRPFTCPGPPRCAFNLCPYQDPIAREPNAIRPFSRAFCLQLQRSVETAVDIRPRNAAFRAKFWSRMADRFTD